MEKRGESRNDAAFVEWHRREGIDGSVGGGSFGGIDLRAVPLPAAAWDDYRVEDLVKALLEKPHVPVDLATNTNIPVAGLKASADTIYGFRTREGRIGLLKLIPIVGPDESYTLQYKLVSGGPLDPLHFQSRMTAGAIP